ncbi:Dual-specificity kinase, spindle pole body (SPB) duplication and spindle checkpoint function [Turnera subulata]|uniref:Dual-specificity kinase, spindle pole body (SPB) duplication and spindle checkpoint function n=1 Tax=Turnera subulata TaxID=218843 RepID=A0A9Q0GDS4_9ROSI|nr:Dual-specificity kinase, spindle pole body (SPB) duplication and spindle checkpoint function [Turnera subulata]
MDPPMDGEANLPVTAKILFSLRSNNADTTSSSTSSSSSSSGPDLLRDMNSIRPRRMVGSGTQREASRNVVGPTKESTARAAAGGKQSQPQDDALKPQEEYYSVKDSIAVAVSAVRETQDDDALVTPPLSGTLTKTFDETFDAHAQLQPPRSPSLHGKERHNVMMPLSGLDSQHGDVKRKVQFSVASNVTFQDMEWDTNNQVEELNAANDEAKHQTFLKTESEITLRSDGGVSALSRGTMAAQDQMHQLENFLGQPNTQSSVVGRSNATTTSVHSYSAPMLNSTTHCSRSYPETGFQAAVEPLEDLNLNSHNGARGNVGQLSYPSLKEASGMLVDQKPIKRCPGTATTDAQCNECHVAQGQQSIAIMKEPDILNNSSNVDNKSIKARVLRNDGADPHQASLSKNLSSDVNLETSKPERDEKVATGKSSSGPRKKSYDPDLFFKVNGKLYQRLGKIGSGGSSEVHKVISSDCTIYALKKIKLKGRDYATAFGFCQEIEYLNKLKGKDNIIQLIDYEVTDKTLLREVMNGSMNNKDGRVKDDGHIYMVLEYGEIDLARMLSQKWKEMESSSQTIDENWLRFYWQAVNTIHEERIVHSDLKPANFLLVKGSLKLIDFGIAKAINSDTTNIQRDSQVGTLSYMSPEAFMCNETDENGNTIKCGRPSDIWSLGCILYQMVYGRTPFAEYKTFWAKFKVITDPNYEITYEPVSNPWLLDLMKKCLAWDRNKRWRIPQLLQHPFLVPQVQPEPSPSQEPGFKLLQLVAEACSSNQEAYMLYCELQQLLRDPVTSVTSQSLTLQSQQCKLLSKMSRLCFQLHECLSKLESE